MRLFGLTKNGNSVLLHVHGFKPYFYVAAPKDFMSEDCRSLKDNLNVSCKCHHHLFPPGSRTNLATFSARSRRLSRLELNLQ